MTKKFLISFLAFATVLFASCSSDDDEGGSQEVSFKLSASIDGGNLRTDSVTAATSMDGSVLTIVGTSDMGNLTIVVASEESAENLTNGTYAFEMDHATSIAFSNGGINYTSTSDLGGFITLNTIDFDSSRVFGSFQATLVNVADESETIVVTNGDINNIEFSQQ